MRYYNTKISNQCKKQQFIIQKVVFFDEKDDQPLFKSDNVILI